MTAAELIDMLHAHPKTCERLGITLGTAHSIDYMAVDDVADAILGSEDPENLLKFFLRWLIGAGSEYLTDRGIGLPEWVGDGWRCYRRGVAVPCSDESHSTMLRALLAAIEAIEETT